MSITLTPRHTLGFPRPLTSLGTQTLTITNPNDRPVTYKVKTTAAEVFCVRPNPGRIEPGETVHVAVMHEPMSTEPPTTEKCKHKFLVLSTLIRDDVDGDKSLQEIWKAVDSGGKEVHRYKMRVRYLPVVKYQTVHEDEGESHTMQAGPSDSMSPAITIMTSVLSEDENVDSEEFFVAHEELHCSRPSSVQELDSGTQNHRDSVVPPPTSCADDLENLIIKLNEAEAEIEHLKGLLEGLTSDRPSSKPNSYRRWYSIRVSIPNALAIIVAVFVVTYLFL